MNEQGLCCFIAGLCFGYAPGIIDSNYRFMVVIFGMIVLMVPKWHEWWRKRFDG